MFKNAKVQGLLVLALGGLLGYGVAPGKVSSLLGADERNPPRRAIACRSPAYPFRPTPRPRSTAATCRRHPNRPRAGSRIPRIRETRCRDLRPDFA
jgi:hypothetical protein